jgi:hypothetical protein
MHTVETNKSEAASNYLSNGQQRTALDLVLLTKATIAI